MTGKYLGKIIRAEFGMNRDYPFYFGLELEFSMESGNVCGTICTNIEHCIHSEMFGICDKIRHILIDAKCEKVSQLVEKPVEVTIEDNTYRTFRILKECL